MNFVEISGLACLTTATFSIIKLLIPQQTYLYMGSVKLFQLLDKLFVLKCAICRYFNYLIHTKFREPKLSSSLKSRSFENYEGS